MDKVLHHKVVVALPDQLEPDSIYYVRAGTGFDQYVTNSGGIITAYPSNRPVTDSDWVDLRPYLKTNFYFDSARNGRNSHPRIRKHYDGRVELDGVVSFNAIHGPIQPGVFVRVPAEFRPTLTTGGLMFGDTGNPLSFGACNWLVMGKVEYSPPRVHGDIMMIPLTLTSPAQYGAISLNGIFWLT